MNRKMRDEYLRLRHEPMFLGGYTPRLAFTLAKALTARNPMPGYREDEEATRSSYLPAYRRTAGGWDIRVAAVDDAEGTGCLIRHRKDAGLEHEGYGLWTEEARAPRHPRDGISLGEAEDTRYGAPRFRIFRGLADYGNDWDSLYQTARERGMAKGPAYDAARAELKRLAERSDELLSGRGDLCVVGIKATVSRAGIELGHAAVWGFEWSFKERETFERLDFPETARDVVTEALAEARTTRAALCGRGKARAK